MSPIFISHRHSERWLLNATTSTMKKHSIWQVHCKWTQSGSTSLHLIYYLLSSFHTDTHNAEPSQQQHRRRRSTAFRKCIENEHSEALLLSTSSLTYYPHFPQTLTTLNIDRNNIRAEGAQNLASALQVNTVRHDFSPSHLLPIHWKKIGTLPCYEGSPLPH